MAKVTDNLNLSVNQEGSRNPAVHTVRAGYDCYNGNFGVVWECLNDFH